MNIQLNYFGMLTEVTGCTSEQMETDSNKIGDLLSELVNRYPGLEEKQFQIAQNQEIVTKDEVLSGAEIALLPPFSGG